MFCIELNASVLRKLRIYFGHFVRSMFSLETSFQVFSLEIPISEKTFTWNRQRIEYQEQGFSILCQSGSVFGLLSGLD